MKLTELAYRLDGLILSEATESINRLDDLKNFSDDFVKEQIIPFVKGLNLEKISSKLSLFVKNISAETKKPYTAFDVTKLNAVGPRSLEYISRENIEGAKLILDRLKNGDKLTIAMFDPLGDYRYDRKPNDIAFTQDDQDQIAAKVQNLADKKFGRGRYLISCDTFLSGRHLTIHFGAGPKLLKSFQDSLEQAIKFEEGKPKKAASGASAAGIASKGQQWSVATVELDGEEAIEVADDFPSYKEALKYAQGLGLDDGTAVYVVKGTQRYLKPLGVTEEGDDDATVWLVNSYE